MTEAVAQLVRRADMTLDDGDFHYIVLSFIHAWLMRTALPAAQGTLLDYGSGGQPYRALFETKVQKYLAADVRPTPGCVLDITLAPEGKVPLEDASVDTVLSSQTLEHVPDPLFYLRECQRLLRSGGALILTAPMQWRHHEAPHDYYRFTKYGLENLLARAGLRVESVAAAGGAFALMGQILCSALFDRGVRSRVVFKLINRCVLWLDRRYPDGEDTINWMVIARKP
ncbi:MAG: methyltransferase domain-containing protein [Rhodospirillaceae bacterium]|nr:methyltransferase domain-containing protein [Rhodospirillaceae bacterium]